MARPKLGEGETERLHVKISQEELTAIDDWRFANRVPSRSEAVRRLCQIGLQADESLGRIRDQANGTYEFMAGRAEQYMKDIKKLSGDKDKWVKNLLALLTLCIDTMQMVGNFGSTARPAADRSEAMKAAGKVPELIARSEEIARDHEIARKRISELVARVAQDTKE